MKSVRLILLGVIPFILASCLDGEDPNKQINAELSQIDQYLQSAGLADDALYDNNNGYRIVINQYGENPPPHDGQTVKVQYQGRLFPNGATFDSDVLESKLESLTPQAIQYVSRNVMGGTYATLYVPSTNGYGAQGSAALGVPANATLIYDIYLEEVNRTAVEQSRFETDSTAIANYLDENEISTTYHPGGIWYTITEQGNGDYPTVYSSITCAYKLKLLTNPGTNLQDATLQQNFILGLIDGFKVAMPLFNEGTKATFYVPSGLAYRESGSGSVPANANLIFEITLNTVH